MNVRPSLGVVALALLMLALHAPLLQTPSPALVAVAQPPALPLASLSTRLDHALFDDAPAVPHAENFLLLAVATVLTALLARRAGANDWQAVGAAALVGLHPAAIEAVARLSARGDLLALVLSLAAVLATQRQLRFAPVAAMALSALALLSSPLALALAPLVLVVGLTSPAAGAGWQRAVLCLVVTPLGLGFVTWSLASWKPQWALGELGRLVALTAWPGAVVPFFPAPGVIELLLGGLIVVVALAALVLRAPAPVRFGLLWFLAAAWPAVGLVPFVAPLSAVHVLLPLAGVGVAMRALPSRVHAALGLGIAVAFTASSFHAERAWEDDVSLGAENVAVFPGLPAARLAFGRALADVMNGGARAQFEEAARLAKEQHDGATFARAQLLLGQLALPATPSDAEAHFRAGLEVQEGLALSELGVFLARSLVVQGRDADALDVLEAQWARTATPAVGRAGLDLAQRVGSAETIQRWRDRVK